MVEPDRVIGERTAGALTALLSPSSVGEAPRPQEGALVQVERPSSPALAGGFMLVGAAASVTGVFLDWFEVTWRGGSHGVQGLEGSGAGVIVLAVLVAAFAIVMLARARKKGGRAWSITALVFAAFVFAFAAVSALAPEQALPSFVSREVSESLNISERSATAAVADAIKAGELNATSGIGAYLALAGGALAVAGAIIGIGSAKRFRRMPQPTGSALFDVVPSAHDDLPPPPMPPLDQSEHGTLDTDT